MTVQQRKYLLSLPAYSVPKLITCPSPPFLPELGARVLERSKYFQERVRVRAFRRDQTTIINETTTNANHTAF